MSQFGQGKRTIFYSDILELVSEEGILDYYTQISSIPCLINSPFRKDSKPSLSVFYSRTDRISFKDHATNESYNLLGFLMKLLNIQDPDKAILEIHNNIPKIKKLDVYYIGNIHKDRNTRGRRKTSKELNVRTRPFQDHDLEFWASFGITEEWLKFGRVYAISHIFLDSAFYKADKYAYVYVEFKEGNPTFKVYQPFSKTWKWLSNHGGSVWDLWQQAFSSNSKDIIVTSSRKDALTLWANIGIPSVALQSETTLPKPHVVDLVTQKFENIYCLYDNDYNKEKNYGEIMSLKLNELYGFKHIQIPQNYESKDPSDLILKVGQERFKTIINNLIY